MPVSKKSARGLLNSLTKKKDNDRIEPTFGDEDLSAVSGARVAAKPGQNELFADERDDAEDLAEESSAEHDAAPANQEVLIINVMARPETVLEGRKLLPVLLAHGLRLGDMNIFHRHADSDGNGPVMFSMANMVTPGTFALAEMETFTTPGVSFFMQIPNKLGNMRCFDQMLQTAEAVQSELNAQLKDENRSVFTRQTIEHSRQRIRDFELASLSRK